MQNCFRRPGRRKLRIGGTDRIDSGTGFPSAGTNCKTHAPGSPSGSLLLLNEKRYRVYLHRLYTRYVLKNKQLLLNFNFSASLFELRFDLFSFFLRNTFLYGFRSTVDEVFRFLQTQTGNVLDSFYHLQFGLTSVYENHVERRFLGSGGTAFGSGSGSNGNSSSSGLNSVFLFQNIGKFVYFFNCQVYQLLS